MARAAASQDIEIFPEADRLEGFSHPRETTVLFGHAAAERILLQALAADRLHHGWMIAGREGIGKATLAYRFARFLLARTQERDAAHAGLKIRGDASTARQVRALSHPGLLLIRRQWDTRGKRFGASIPVDEVRRVRGFLAHTADAGAWRIVIVDTADELNPNAANALLKSLEEPPSRTVFLLLTCEPGRLLPTIRSRCRTLQLAPLAIPELRKAATAALEAAEAAVAPETLVPLETLAEGSVRRLLELGTSDGVALYGRIEAMFNNLPRVDWPAAHLLADDLGNPAAEQRFETFFNLLLGVLGRTIRAAASPGTGPVDAALAARLMPEKRLAAWAEVWESIVREKAETLELNLDRRALVLGVISRLGAAARP